MKTFTWNADKNLQLIESRGISFEDVLYFIQRNALLDDVVHPNQAKYPQQRMFIVAIDGYVYLVPYVEDEDKIFLKTVIPSRKATREYLSNQQEDDDSEQEGNRDEKD
jgi:uncharacterized DUF497 family protein